jgi:para-nitrobenzyl esterase
VAALRWVREHIADFGGDPTNVTIFGESAGGMCVATLLAAPLARGLFHRAIIESGPPYAHSRSDAAQIGVDLVDVLGLSDPTRERLESVPARELVSATAILQARRPRPGQLPLPFLPVVDGTFLPSTPYDVIATGQGAAVPLLIGTNRDELTLFTLNMPGLAELDEARLAQWTSLAAPGVPPAAVIDTYRRVRAARAEPVDTRELWVAVASDLVFRWPSLRLAAAHRQRAPAYVYLFTWEAPVLDGKLGASHALEIPFVFGRLDMPVIATLSGSGAEADALSDRMLRAWAAFARAGDPSHAGIGTWPAWEPERRTTMVLGPGGGPAERPRDDELAVWERWIPLAGAARAELDGQGG